jgi:p-cymene monooxygenase electron transfer component
MIAARLPPGWMGHPIGHNISPNRGQRAMGRLFGRSDVRDEPRHVSIAQTGKKFVAPGKDSILNEALAAGVAFPHSCTVGTCGTCKAKLLSGKVREITDSAVALSSEELRDGYILACQSIARRSLELDVAGMADLPDHPLKHLGAVVAAQTMLTHDIVQMTIELDAPLEFTAGQYVELKFDEFSGPRSYSFADAPSRCDGRTLNFFVRHVPGGEFTDWLFGGDRSGEHLTVTGPLGNLWLRPSDAPVLCVAGGSGLAPIKAILEDAMDARSARSVVLVFGARQQRDLYCQVQLDALAKGWNGTFDYQLVLSEESPHSTWTGPRGLVTDVVAALPMEFLQSCEVYTCGPPVMIDALEEAVMSVRSGSGFFHADRFVTRRGGSG